MCLNTQTTLQYKHQKKTTLLIEAIRFDINASKIKITNNSKREVWISARLMGMISTDFFFIFLVFLVIFSFFFIYS